MPNRFDEAAVLVDAHGLSVARGGRQILSDVDVRVRAGEIVTLIGPNGAGKTTVVLALLGLLRPDRGEVTRKDGLVVGYMPQRLHVDSTLPLTVGRFLALGIDAVGWDGDERATRTLAEVGAGPVLETPFNDISGGELQRVLLARALLRDPELLVLDEPSQGIDVTGQAELYRLITRIRDQRGCGVLMVSHDLHLVMAETDEVVCINQHVCCAGHPETVAADPAYIQLFGRQVAGALAVYHHEHDHTHGGDGSVVPLPRSDGKAKPGEPPGHG